MGKAESPSKRLRSALRALAEADAAELTARARERARLRAAKLIEDALVEEIVEAAGRINRADAPAPRPESNVERSTAKAWWTYCVLSAAESEKVPSALEGVEPGSVVEVLNEGDLAALISPVPAVDYDDIHLREHLEDLAWVERTARRHEAVLEQALMRVSIVPLRLCTLYRGRDGVRRLLREHGDGLRQSLDKVTGCAEWGVKVFAGDAASEQVEGTEPEESLADRPGATYLLHRQRERERSEKAAEVRARCVEEVHERVSACSREAITNPPQRPELHGRGVAMLLNGAYLVADEQTDDLDQTARALKSEWEPRGFVIELTGPWPAYNFVSGAAGVVP